MTRAQLKELIGRIHDEWAPIFGLAEWEREWYVAHEQPDPSGPDKGRPLATIGVDWEYEQYMIACSPELQQKDEPEVERRILHELSHILTEPLASFALSIVRRFIEDEKDGGRAVLEEQLTRLTELCTTRTAKALMRARNR